MKTLLNFFWFWCLFINCLIGNEIEPVSITISGSNTVSNILIEPYKKEIEKNANLVLTVKVNGSIEGLTDLALGRCNIAMISATLESIASILNEGVFGFIKLEEYEQFKIGESDAVFITNKKNPIEYLTLDQLKRIAMGDILNWNLVGGNDERIIFFTMFKGDGVRTTIQDQLLKGDFFGIYTTAVRDSKLLEAVVGHLPGAMGIDNVYGVTDLVKVIKTETNFSQPLILVTKGKPNSELARLIDVVKDVNAKATKSKIKVNNETNKM